MATTEIWRDFDPNLQIPIGLKNARRPSVPTRVGGSPDSSPNIDVQQDSLSDDDADLEDSTDDTELEVPSTFSIVSQTVRTGPDGAQVVDVVIDVEEVDGAVTYEIRITK